MSYNQAQYFFDLSLCSAARSCPVCDTTGWPTPNSRYYSDPAYCWPYEVQAINCLTEAGRPIPTYPVFPNPDPTRQQAIQRWSVDEKLWATALTQCQMTLPKPNLQDYIDDPAYLWPYVDQAMQCPGNNPA